MREEEEEEGSEEEEEEEDIEASESEVELMGEKVVCGYLVAGDFEEWGWGIGECTP